MTKALTEQWREGTLDGGYYYLKTKDKEVVIDHTEYVFWAKEIRWETKDNDYVKEVLAPVPSYDKVKEMSQKIGRLEFDNEALEMSRDELEKKLAIATKALKKIIRDYEINGIGYLCVTRAKEALKEMEGVK